MAVKIRWYKKAESKLNKIVKHVKEEWGEKSAKDLIQKINSVTTLLKKYPELGTMQVPNRNIRGILVVKQLKLFYIPAKYEIKIIQVFDTRQSPRRKPK